MVSRQVSALLDRWKEKEYDHVMKNAVLNSDINRSAGSWKGRQGLWLSLFLAAAAFVLMLPLFLGGPRNGYDTLFHLANVDKLFEQLQQNPLFPSRVVGVRPTILVTALIYFIHPFPILPPLI